MKKTFYLLGILVISLSACNKNQEKTSSVDLKTKQDSVSYSLGVVIANSIQKDNYYGDINYDAFVQGFKEFIAENSKISADEAEKFLKQYNADKALSDMKKAKEENDKFMSDNAKKEGITTDENGIQYKVIKKGNGISPDTNDVVYVYYKGMLIDGTVFDSTKSDQPAKFDLSGLIPGMKMALLKMKEGDEWEVYIPYNLAYGEYGIPNTPIKPYSTLIFDIKLDKVEKK